MRRYSVVSITASAPTAIGCQAAFHIQSRRQTSPNIFLPSAISVASNGSTHISHNVQVSDKGKEPFPFKSPSDARPPCQTSVHRRASVIVSDTVISGNGSSDISSCSQRVSHEGPFHDPSTRSQQPSAALLRRCLTNIAHGGRQCCYCGKDLRGLTSRRNPAWEKEEMCDTCYETIPRCFSCERKAVAYTCPSTSATTLPSNFGSLMEVCGKCSSLGSISSPRSVRLAKENVINFYKSELKLDFTSDMLKNQHLSRNPENGFSEQRRTSMVTMSSITNQGRRMSAGIPVELNVFVEETSQESKSLPVKAVALSKMNNGTSSAMAYAKFGQCDCCKVRLRGVERRFVDQILISKGLPAVLFSTHLSHEMFHAWLHLSEFPDLTPKLEEGLCNAVGVMFLQHTLASIRKNVKQAQKQHSLLSIELMEFSLKKFYENESEVYGDGFREAYKCIQRLGFHQTLAFVKANAMLP